MKSVLNSLDMRGSIQLDSPPDGLTPGRYVIQRVGKGFGNLAGFAHGDRQLRRHVVPADPKTTSQLNRRQVMRDAVTSWHAASQTERAKYAPAAARRGITIFNAWVSQWLLDHP